MPTIDSKAELARQIGAIIRQRRLTQKVAAHIFSTDQPKMSALLAGFSPERLGHFLTLLGKDVETVVREKSPTRPVGRLSVLSV